MNISWREVEIRFYLLVAIKGKNDASVESLKMV